MSTGPHIPYVETITDFYELMRIGIPQGNDLSIMRIEDQPESKREHMPLFRCNVYRVIFLINSQVDWNLPNENIKISDQCIYFAYPGKLESWIASKNNFGYLVSFSEEFGQKDSISQSLDQHFPFFNFEGQSLLNLSDQEAESLKPLVEEMIIEISRSNPDRYEMLRHLLHRYLISIKRIYLQKEDNIPDKERNNLAVYNRFKKEMDNYFANLAAGKEFNQASVSAIADKMSMTASYLNSVIKNLTGKPASHHIHEKTALEAKSYLMHTDLQMAEVSHRLGFSNISYFNRFFKRLTNEIPMRFKKAQTS